MPVETIPALPSSPDAQIVMTILNKHIPHLECHHIRWKDGFIIRKTSKH